MHRSTRRYDVDAELIQHVAQGDENAFEQLVKKYEHAVFNIIYRYTGHYDDVEDLAQEVFMKVWRHAKSFKGKSKFSTWLYRIVVNHCLNYKSKHRHTLVSLDEMTEKEKIPESLVVEVDLEQRQKAEIIRKAVEELPERQRIALLLSKLEDKSYKEIAAIMKISVSAVESLIFRAKEALKKKLIPLRNDGKL
jgi:RNA polymerase sigma-70 factor (ECF subfamily)